MAGRLTRLMIEEMAKHLPPSGATLHLLDLDGQASPVLTNLRADLAVQTATPETLPAESVDAVVAFGGEVAEQTLVAALHALRRGGRLIITNPDGEPNATQVQMLERLGYTRILVQAGVECPMPVGVMMRGEKPHITEDTLERIDDVAAGDDAVALNLADVAAYRGRYLYLLVQQSPNKPVWKLTPQDVITWQAVTIAGEPPTLLAFSSLPRAVSFMQPTVLAGRIRDVNKVAKFSKATAQTWTLPVLLNPTVDALDAHTLGRISIDPATAESSDE
jgi:hypothetical protein